MYMQKIGIVSSTIGVYLFLAHTHTFLTLGTNLHFIRLAQTRANQRKNQLNTSALHKSLIKALFSAYSGPPKKDKATETLLKCN